MVVRGVSYQIRVKGYEKDFLEGPAAPPNLPAWAICSCPIVSSGCDMGVTLSLLEVEVTLYRGGWIET
jgi:hypothetical protein